MTVEYIKEAAFLQEVTAAGELWVAKGAYGNIYCDEFDPRGVSLPVWSNRERVVAFLKNARPIGPKYEPEAVSLEVFTNRWLSDRAMAITEIQLNPDGLTSRVLVVSAEEFRSDQAKGRPQGGSP